MRSLIFTLILAATATTAHAQNPGSNGAADPTAPFPMAPNATYGNTDPATPAVPSYPQPDGSTDDSQPGNCPSVLANRGIPQDEALRMCDEIERGKVR